MSEDEKGWRDLIDARMPEIDPYPDAASDQTHDEPPTNAHGADRRQARPPGPQFVSAESFCKGYEPVSYAVEPFVRSGSIYTLTAKTGAGKTGLVVATAMALVSGAGEKIIGREVTKGRVAIIAAENPDDLRMRIMVAAYVLNIDLSAIGGRFVILDKRTSPEDLLSKLKALSADEYGSFTLIMIDTLAAFFDGDNINDPVQGGNFMRRLRPLTTLQGRPSVIVAAHPVKNAADDNLVPYGAGAILNEVDGNLTLCRAGETTILHWQGKLRGVEFIPTPFRFEIIGSPDVLDVKGRQVQLPVLRPCAEADVEKKQAADVDRDTAVLRAMLESPGATVRALAEASGVSKSAVSRSLQSLKAEKLADATLVNGSLPRAVKRHLDPRPRLSRESHFRSE